MGIRGMLSRQCLNFYFPFAEFRFSFRAIQVFVERIKFAFQKNQFCLLRNSGFHFEEFMFSSKKSSLSF